MNNILRIKGTDEVIKNINANCTACNKTGKVANIRNLLTPWSKDFNDWVAIDQSEWTDPITNQTVILLNMIDEFFRYSVVTVLESKKPVIIKENIVIGWFMQFGTPVSILHDLGR